MRCPNSCKQARRDFGYYGVQQIGPITHGEIVFGFASNYRITGRHDIDDHALTICGTFSLPHLDADT